MRKEKNTTEKNKSHKQAFSRNYKFLNLLMSRASQVASQPLTLEFKNLSV